jgi:hypothetical protein
MRVHSFNFHGFASCGIIVRVTKPKPPAKLPTSPMTLVCPLCGARPGHDCETTSHVPLAIVHVKRIEAAAYVDSSKKQR